MRFIYPSARVDGAASVRTSGFWVALAMLRKYRAAGTTWGGQLAPSATVSTDSRPPDIGAAGHVLNIV